MLIARVPGEPVRPERPEPEAEPPRVPIIIPRALYRHEQWCRIAECDLCLDRITGL